MSHILNSITTMQFQEPSAFTTYMYDNLNVHMVSPLLFIVYVRLLTLIRPIPNSNVMKFCRKLHNIVLSLLSLFMLITITQATFAAGKFESLNDLLCVRYVDGIDDSVTNLAHMSASLFLYSKYLEWGDTLFLQLSNKPISMLQYTHHMTTAFLMYMNYVDYLSPQVFIFMGLNCFVHIWMYWYFAFPKGVLYPVRKLITQLQILQHIICICTTVYTFTLPNCQQNAYGNDFCLVMYSMYLFYFSAFYVKSYIKKKNQ